MAKVNSFAFTVYAYVLVHTPSKRRCAARRAEQATDEFAEHYAIRAGLESVNSALKRGTGLGRLRTRGLRRMRMGVLLRCAGWNMKRATAALRTRARKTQTDLAAVLAAAETAPLTLKSAADRLVTHITAAFARLRQFLTPAIAPNRAAA
jgi:hypothetical protein